MIEINKIYNCDNKQILKDISDKSIQVFLEDMPQNITNCKFEYKVDLQEYWNLRLSKIKDNGCFVLFGNEPFSSYLRMSNIKMYRYDWVWEKINATGHLNSKKMPMRAYETISIFYKKLPIYNPQMVLNQVRKVSNNVNRAFKLSECYGNQKGITNYDSTERYPRNIIKFSTDKQKIAIHPTQKPVALIEYLIKTYSDEGDLIFDGFSGSGTTSIVCMNLKRNFICCELDKNYYDKSIKRLEELNKI